MSTTPQDPSDPQHPGGLGLTTAMQAAVAALAGAVVGYFIVGTMMWRGATVPVTPWSLPLLVGAFAVGALVYARSLRRQVRDERGNLTPEVAVRALVLGKTLLMTGAVLAGGHALYVGTYLGQVSAPLPRQRVTHGLVMILASLVCALAGHQLERACLVPPGDEPDDETPPQV